MSSSSDSYRAHKARERAQSGVYPLTRRERQRARAGMPPLPGQRWAPFDSLGASAGISKATVGKLAKAGRFRSIRLPGIKNVRIGDVEDFNRLLDDIAAQGPDFEEAPEVKPGSKRRGRPKKPVETASES